MTHTRIKALTTTGTLAVLALIGLPQQLSPEWPQLTQNMQGVRYAWEPDPVTVAQDALPQIVETALAPEPVPEPVTPTPPPKAKPARAVRAAPKPAPAPATIVAQKPEVHEASHFRLRNRQIAQQVR